MKRTIVYLILLSAGLMLTAQSFKVGDPETVLTFERMKDLGIREFDTGLFMMTENENCKWFSSCSKTPEGQTVTVGPREEPFEYACEVSKQIEGLPNRRRDRDWAGNFAWVANVYDMKHGHVLAFIHTEERIHHKYETEKKRGVYTRFGLALSRDGGRNFKWLGYIYEPNFSFREWYTGSGSTNPGYANYILKDGYFQVYYRDVKWEDGKTIEGVAVMRAPIDEVVRAALEERVTVWHKYHEGEWKEPGLGGKFTALNIPVRGIMHGDAAYCEYLNKYVLVVRGHKWEDVKKGEIQISFSDDGFTWTDWQIIYQDKHLNDYPSIISMGDDNEILGKEFYVYYLKHYDKEMPEKFGKVRYDRVKVTLD